MQESALAPFWKELLRRPVGWRGIKKKLIPKRSAPPRDLQRKNLLRLCPDSPPSVALANTFQTKIVLPIQFSSSLSEMQLILSISTSFLPSDPTGAKFKASITGQLSRNSLKGNLTGDLQYPLHQPLWLQTEGKSLYSRRRWLLFHVVLRLCAILHHKVMGVLSSVYSISRFGSKPEESPYFRRRWLLSQMMVPAPCGPSSLSLKLQFSFSFFYNSVSLLTLDFENFRSKESWWWGIAATPSPV